MPDHARGLLDTSVVIDLDVLTPELLPAVLLISAVTLAELSQGPHATEDLVERTVRQDRLQRVEGLFDVLAFDVEAARAHGRLYAAVRSAGRQPRRRTVDLYIAAVALANALPLYTRNPDDFHGLSGLTEIVAV